MDSGMQLARLVQRGTVSDVDNATGKVRVFFPETDITSGWLQVLQHFGARLSVTEDGGHNHTVGNSTSEVDPHRHDGSTLGVWLPRVHDRVLVLYLPVANGDGFVLGGI